MLLAANLGAMIFIIVSMVTLGLSTTVSQVLAPLKDKNLMSRAILANFILVPVLAYLLVSGLHLPAGHRDWIDPGWNGGGIAVPGEG